MLKFRTHYIYHSQFSLTKPLSQNPFDWQQSAAIMGIFQYQLFIKMLSFTMFLNTGHL